MYSLTYYLLPTILILIVVRKYRESKWGKCKNTVNLKEKVAIVTGANSGIGLEIARELTLRNATVIMACRNLDKARDACEYIKANCWDNPAVVAMELDLASLESIKNFANNVKKNYKHINLLINNAGVSYPIQERVTTSDGFEINFGVNHLGHFYLTNLLLDSLTATADQPSRVVIVASSLHEKGEIDLEDLNSLNASDAASLYANSKLANVYFAQELARQTESKNIHVYACCPGWVYTGLFRHSIKWYHYFLAAPFAFFFMRAPNQGAQTPLYCATDPDIENESGLMYKDCAQYDSKVILYDNIAYKLWEKSEEMISEVMENKRYLH